MKTGDVLSRSIDNVIANWEAMALQIGIAAAVTLAFVAAWFAMWMPVWLNNGDSIEPRWIIVIAVGAVIVAGLLWSLAMAFPTAAITRLYIDGHRAAAALPERPRAAYRTYSWPAWRAAGKAMWARVFGIYVVAGAITVIAIGVPLLLVVGFRESPMACCGMVVLVPLVIGAAFILPMWVKKAIVIAVARGSGVERSLGDAWDDLIPRFGEHFVPLFIIGLLGAASSSVLATIGSAAAHCWTLAALVPLTERR